MVITSLALAPGVKISWEIDTDEKGLMGMSSLAGSPWMALSTKE